MSRVVRAAAIQMAPEFDAPDGTLQRVCAAIDEAETIASGGEATLVIAADYGGCWDIAQAARVMAEQVGKGQLAADSIDEELLARYLCTRDLPPLDLLIRTGGEIRISNFLLWQISYAEIWVTDKCWPEFDEAALHRAARRVGRAARVGHDERHLLHGVVELFLLAEPVVAEIVAVVGGEDDQRVVQPAGIGQRLRRVAAVHEAGRRVVVRDECLDAEGVWRPQEREHAHQREQRVVCELAPGSEETIEDDRVDDDHRQRVQHVPDDAKSGASIAMPQMGDGMLPDEPAVGEDGREHGRQHGEVFRIGIVARKAVIECAV